MITKTEIQKRLSDIIASGRWRDMVDVINPAAVVAVRGESNPGAIPEPTPDRREELSAALALITTCRDFVQAGDLSSWEDLFTFDNAHRAALWRDLDRLATWAGEVYYLQGIGAGAIYYRLRVPAALASLFEDVIGEGEDAIGEGDAVFIS